MLIISQETVEIEKSQKDKKQLIAKKEQLILNRQALEVENLETRLVTKKEAFMATQQQEVQRYSFFLLPD